MQTADNISFPESWQWIELAQTESTNNYAMGLVHAALAYHGTSVFAHHQTNGKGRLGKQWLANAGENIALSVILKPDFLSPAHAFRLSVAVALASFDFISRYANEVSIKWPNDIYIGEKKVGGILIENIVGSQTLKWSVAGIGLNINQEKFDESLPNAISLKQATGKNYSCVDLAKELCSCLHKRFEELRTKDFDLLLKEYNEHLFKKDQSVKFKKQNIVFEARIKEVNANGKLVVHTSMEEQFDLDEISWLL